MTDRRIYMIYGNKAKEMTMSLMEAANIKNEISADAKIGLKPNLGSSEGVGIRHHNARWRA